MRSHVRAPGITVPRVITIPLGMTLRLGLPLVVAAVWMLSSGAALSHHTYAMFDASRIVKVSGTVAKLEWTNPHVFVWLYVPAAAGSPAKYDLYAFENGSPNALSKVGWNKSILQAGDAITVEYWPLRDGRKGGHLSKVTLADGRVIGSVGGIAGHDTR